MVSIATWNINSVRLRADQVTRFLQQEAPDVLCLQEIKVAEHLFPHEMFEELGYTHRAIHGQKGYHGVATSAASPSATSAVTTGRTTARHGTSASNCSGRARA